MLSSPYMATEPLTLAQEIEARNLYLYENWTPPRIASELGVKTTQINNLVNRERLYEVKTKGREIATQTAAQTALRASEAFAAKAEQHALKALDRTGEALNEGNARDASSYASTARNLVGLARAVLGTEAAESGPRITNLFLVNAATPPNPADPAASAIPVETVAPDGSECLD